MRPSMAIAARRCGSANGSIRRPADWLMRPGCVESPGRVGSPAVSVYPGWLTPSGDGGEEPDGGADEGESGRYPAAGGGEIMPSVMFDAPGMGSLHFTGHGESFTEAPAPAAGVSVTAAGFVTVMVPSVPTKDGMRFGLATVTCLSLPVIGGSADGFNTVIVPSGPLTVGGTGAPVSAPVGFGMS